MLVTGAGGFIASHLVEALANQGAHVKAFVRYNSRNDPANLVFLSDEAKKSVEIIGGDLRDPQALLLASKGTSLIYHLGALISIPYSYLHPFEVIETNVIGTTNVLLAAKENEVERVIHTSTSEVYGTALQVPINELHPLQGQSPYSASKIGADKIADSFHLSYDLPIVTVRPFNTYGPRQSTRAVISAIITQALTKDNVRLGNLNATRDFTYVSDTVAGFLAAGEKKGIEGQTFNLGFGNEIRIGDLAELIIELVGRPVKIESDPERLRPENSEVQRLLSDNSKAKIHLGWQPRISLKQGLSDTIDWVDKNIHLFNPGKYEI